MNYDDMKKDAASRSNFVKLEKDVPTKIKFLSEDFKKVEKDFGQGPVIKYEVPCIVNGENKFYQGSAKFYENCMNKATNREKKLTDLIYIITKSGEGLQTTYDIDVADQAPVDQGSVSIPAEEKVEGVPF